MLTEEKKILFIKKILRQTKNSRVVWLYGDKRISRHTSHNGTAWIYGEEDYRTTILGRRLCLSVFNGHLKLSILDDSGVSAYDIIKPQYFLTELYRCIKRQVVETDKGIEDWVESILAKDNFFRKITTKVNSIVRIIKPENKSYEKKNYKS